MVEEWWTAIFISISVFELKDRAQSLEYFKSLNSMGPSGYLRLKWCMIVETIFIEGMSVLFVCARLLDIFVGQSLGSYATSDICLCQQPSSMKHMIMVQTSPRVELRFLI